MEDKFTLKAPRRVGEEEFLKYVNEKCDGSTFARRQILDYYEEMKRIDEENGKHLTPESFGRTSNDDMEFYDYCDQAKNLFLTDQQKKLDKQSHIRFCTAAKNATEEERKKLAKVRGKEQKAIFKDALPPIGFADLFRYQFMNFVDLIVLDKPRHDKTVGGSVNMSENRILIYDYTEKQYAYTDLKRFTTQKTWRHELTHIMAIKSDHACKHKYISRVHHRAAKYSSYRCEKDWLMFPDGNRNEKAFDFFYRGAILICEFATDLFTEKIMGDRALGTTSSARVLKETQNSPLKYDMYVKELNVPKPLIANTAYLPFGCVFNAITAFSEEKRPFIVPNNYQPTHRLQDVVYKFLDQGTLSPHIEKIVNERLNALADIDMTFLEGQKRVREKFLIILGAGYNYAQEHEGLNDFNPHTMLAQAMVLDIQHNYFKDYIKKMSVGYQGTIEQKQKLYKYLRQQLKDVENFGDWVIKPNAKLGEGDKAKYARRSLSNNALAKVNEDNIAQKVWAEYLQTLGSFTHKYAPHLLEEYAFLKKELAGKTQALQKLKQKEDQFWL